MLVHDLVDFFEILEVFIVERSGDDWRGCRLDRWRYCLFGKRRNRKKQNENNKKTRKYV
jgi:hypothetical protein